MPIDRRQMKEDLLKATQDAPTMGRGNFGKSFFKDGLDEKGVLFWQCGAADHLIDIIPYIAGPNNPNFKEGKYAYFCIIFVHRNVGPTKDSYVCPAFTYKKPCPICEEWQEAKDLGDEARSKALKPQQMVIYNIICYDNDKEVQKGVQVWPVAWWNFQRFVDVLAKRSRTGGLIPYSDPDSGKSIAFTRQGNKKENTVYLGHRFEDRDYTINDEQLADAWPLDELFEIPTYDQLYEAFYGEPKPAEQAPPPPAQGAPVARAGRRTLDTGGSASDPAPAPTPDPAPAPAGRGARGRQAPAPDPAPAPAPRGARGGGSAPAPAPETNTCPAESGTFGKDTDQLDDCGTCDVYDACARENERVEAERKAKATAQPAGTPRRRTLS
jgi:hypothetical protein